MFVRLAAAAGAFFALTLGPLAKADELSAGAIVVDITPPVGYRMCGYFSERLSTGTKDPLLAKALVLRQGKTQAAIVCCDLIGVPRRVALKARQRASEKTGIPAANIAITGTHSHTGPLFFGALRHFFHERAVAKQGSDPHETVDYPALLVEKLVEAVSKAQAAAVPARLDYGVAEERRLSFNRRFHMKDGSVRFNPGQLNPDIVRVAGPIDPDVGVLRFTRRGDKTAAKADEKALASLTVFAMHLDTTGGTLYSGDYPKYLSDRLQKELGEGHVSLFGAGTCGDINHVDVTTKGRRKTDEIGNLLADTVIAELPKLKEAEPSLSVKNAIVEAPLQKFSPEQVEKAKARMPLIGTRELTFLEQVEANKITDIQHLVRELGGEKLPLEVQVVRLSPDVAVVTLPGEVFVELGLAIKRASPFRATLVIELANDNPAYIPTRKAFAEGSYETVNSRVVSGSGEQMAEAAIRLLKALGESR
jgi:hypothetical protein